MGIEVRNVSKAFGSFQAVQNVSLKIPTGQLMALLGPSGSGKTTLLRLIAGMERADQGQIFFHGEDYTNRRVQERKVGFVFQHYALFQHMNIFENIAFGLKVRPRKKRPSKQEIYERVTELLRLVQLEGLAKRYPAQLSGGQRQRVALARALAVEPKVLLLDEPFGALDAKVRQDLRRWLRQLHEKLQITTVFVTHDQEEALEMADQVVIMNRGRIEQVGTPEEVYRSPANAFVYTFLGRVNLFHGRIHQGKIKLGEHELDVPGISHADEVPAVGYVRPHEIGISREQSEKTSISTIVRHINPVGPIVRLNLKRTDTGELFEVEVSDERYRELDIQVDDTLYVNLKSMKIFLENSKTEAVAEESDLGEAADSGPVWDEQVAE
ncbi:sulfate/molybdate ABC transporter ATP-binding protein [Thermoactinomyces sp. CICC 10523]|uniref:sulfate/molybdate ABC transporter ATP-binding protein n=1 Tax=Thermoactinomyces sp. CICC 10523 TaxID=2767428 RepID=UPI0018DD3267|nr:sulfate/molybdate ABC transporter ATP-binding protein [Thermoactinomyces sp. CICC 10523]MBH8599139.1 sulfate/molybdate ABC transporter ATP-binding protein [Thermoactinomyces sp. CICC 10523]